MYGEIDILLWANVPRNECKFGVTKTYWPYFHKPIYITFKLPNTFLMYNKKKLLTSSFLAYECCIFHLINGAQNGGTLWPKFLYLY